MRRSLAWSKRKGGTLTGAGKGGTLTGAGKGGTLTGAGKGATLTGAGKGATLTGASTVQVWNQTRRDCFYGMQQEWM